METESLSKTYIVETDKFKITVDVDRNGDIKHGANVIRNFYGRPFVEFEKWVSTKFRYCNIQEI